MKKKTQYIHCTRLHIYKQQKQQHNTLLQLQPESCVCLLLSIVSKLKQRCCPEWHLRIVTFLIFYGSDITYIFLWTKLCLYVCYLSIYLLTRLADHWLIARLGCPSLTTLPLPKRTQGHRSFDSRDMTWPEINNSDSILLKRERTQMFIVRRSIRTGALWDEHILLSTSVCNCFHKTSWSLLSHTLSIGKALMSHLTWRVV